MNYRVGTRAIRELIVGTMIRFRGLYRLKGQLVGTGVIGTNPSQAVLVGPVQWDQDFAGSRRSRNDFDVAASLLVLVFGVSDVAGRVRAFLAATGLVVVVGVSFAGGSAGRGWCKSAATANAPGGSGQDGGSGGVRSCG